MSFFGQVFPHGRRGGPYTCSYAARLFSHVWKRAPKNSHIADFCVKTKNFVAIKIIDSDIRVRTGFLRANHRFRRAWTAVRVSTRRYFRWLMPRAASQVSARLFVERSTGCRTVSTLVQQRFTQTMPRPSIYKAENEGTIQRSFAAKRGLYPHTLLRRPSLTGSHTMLRATPQRRASAYG